MIATTTASDATAALLLTDRQAAALAGVGRRTLWALVSKGEFPPPVRLPGARATRWRRADVVAWVDALEC